MYLRFVSGEIDLRTGRQKGIFSLAYNLVDEKKLSYEHEDEIRELLIWFKQHLPIPDKFSKKKNDGHKNTAGLSWVKPTANEAIEKLWSLKSHLEQAGYQIEVLKISNPGKVVYEDDQQLVAVPYGSSR